MSSNRFFVSESGIQGTRVGLSAEQSHQVCHVLRLKTGDRIVVLDNAGYEYDVTLTEVTKREVLGQVVDKRPAGGEPRVQITLFQALVAREKLEWVLQKGTEVGVCRFVPIQTSRSIVRARQINDKKLTRRQKIITEAAEQSHRGRIPEIDEPIDFSEAMSKLGDFDLALMTAPAVESPSLKQVLANCPKTPTSVAIFIGPEGGFSDEEIELASQRGATPIRLGPRVFRTESAGLIATAIALFELGDLDE